MAHPSLQVCIDSSDWLQGTMSDELSSGLDSSSSPSGDCMLAAACSSRAGPPLMERRLRPPHDQHLKCPRCESTHTKFCYYNNYSLSQPRYFCKTCRRYWTKGGTLRNIPVGGGCRKNKKSSSKKSNESGNHHQHQHQPLSHVVGGTGCAATLGPPTTNPMDLHLTFPEVQFPSHLANLIGAQMSLGGSGGSFMDNGFIRPIDFMESKYSHNFLGNSNNNCGDHQFGGIMGGYNGISNGICSSSPFDGVSNCDNIHHDGSSMIGFMDQRLLLPYDANNDHHHQGGIDVKPNPKLLSLEWHQDQGCSHDNSDVVATKDSTTSSFGYNVVNGALGSWSGMMGNFQPSTTNSLV